MIRSIRRIFCALLQQQTLTDDILHTLLVEVEKILNSRPLVPINIDPSADEVLTPNHLLLLRSEDNLPPGIFDKKDNYVRAVGGKHNILQINSGKDGPENTSRLLLCAKSGLTLKVISKSATLCLLSKIMLREGSGGSDV